MPKPLWQCTDQIALSEFGIVSRKRFQSITVQLRHTIAHGIGEVDRRCPFFDDSFKRATRNQNQNDCRLQG